MVTEDAPAYAVLAGVRGLRAAGYEPWVARGAQPSYAARSRDSAGSIRVPDPTAGRDAYVDALAREAERLDARAVLPGTEVGLVALAGARERFPKGVAVGAAGPGAVERATDKGELERLAAAAGLATPPSRRVTAAETDGLDVELPAIVKAPRTSTASGEGFEVAGVHRVESARELADAIRAMPGGVAMVQPALEGDLAAVAGVAWQGEVVVTSHQIASRVFPPGAGISAFAETVPRDPALDAGVGRLIEALGWSGIFQAQFIRGPDGSHLIDLNPRMYGSMALAIAAGLNLPGIWAGLLLGRAPETGDYRVGVRFRSEERDLAGLASALTSGEWGSAGSILRPRAGTAHAVTSWRDPLPLLTLGRRFGRARRALGG